MVAWHAHAADGRKRDSPYVWWHGQRARQALLGTFTFLSATTAPFEQLTLADVQQYTQPISYGITSYELKQWMSVGVRAGQYPPSRRSHD